MTTCSTGQIAFYEKNKIDLENVDIQITVTDAIASNNGQDFVNFMRNRNNYSAFMTTDSTDLANTTLEVFLGDVKAIDSLFLVGHNLKNYHIEYKAGLGSYLDFTDPIQPTDDDNETTYYNFQSVQADTIRIIIYGTQVADADKQIKQLILTEKLGQFEGFPIVKSPTTATNKRNTKMLSGKARVVETLESFKCSLQVKHWRKEADIELVQDLYFLREGFLLWINSNKPEQFFSEVRGYRKQDIYLVRPTNEFKGEYAGGIYSNGLKQSINLAEVIT